MWYPKRPESLAQARVSNYFIQDSILKIIFVRGVTTGAAFSEILRFPFALVDEELKHLREKNHISPIGGTGMGGQGGFDFALTKEGREYAASLYARNPYIGPVPVDIADYSESVQQQKVNARSVKKGHIETAFHDLTISPETIAQLGPALSSGGPIFLYGKPGNGKTSIAERLSRVFRQGIFVPFSIKIDGQIIQLFDEKVHRLVPVSAIPKDHPVLADARNLDSRWAFVYRPFIVVGGELTLEMLDLIFQQGQHYYEAPFQMKANCGMLLVDDFGRQIVKPKDFLNRWIFPLEKGTDFLTLITGKKVEVPFEQILVFSTNLNPAELADEAFWRRIKYKIEILNPSEADFKKMFKSACEKEKVEFDEPSFNFLIENFYKQGKRELRSVHARDILGKARDYLEYNNLKGKLSPELVKAAGDLYFGNIESF